MPRKQPELTYPIEHLEIEVGGRELIIDGYAKYEIINGTDPSAFATFTRLKITNWDCNVKTPRGTAGLTKDDIKAVEDSILDNLNENYELCEYLASEKGEGF